MSRLKRKMQKASKARKPRKRKRLSFSESPDLFSCATPWSLMCCASDFRTSVERCFIYDQAHPLRAMLAIGNRSARFLTLELACISGAQQRMASLSVDELVARYRACARVRLSQQCMQRICLQGSLATQKTTVFINSSCRQKSFRLVPIVVSFKLLILRALCLSAAHASSLDASARTMLT
eukprot:11068-Heterococcus_DN1.PRE.1